MASTVFPALLGVVRGAERDFHGLCGVVGVLFDVRAHLFHRRRDLLNRRCLLGRALAQLFRSYAHLLRARRDVV
jgi:hypothetical protein